MARSPIKVMIIDDSALVRQTLAKIVEADPDLEVCATAQDPFVAAERLKRQVPDVITLDVEMPRMDGITFLRKIMSQRPIPVVICSSLAGQGSATLTDALEAGAVEIIQKPRVGTQRFFEESSIQITDILKAASQACPRRQAARPTRSAEKLSADAMISPSKTRAMAETTEKIIVIGSSTGGPGAVGHILEAMPRDAPGILIVQHMQEGFTKSFAERLDACCAMHVREARDGDNVLRGRALVAPGGKHMLLKRSGARYYVQIKDGPLVSRHRPSVDVLFRSSARYGGKNCIAAILTGMGDDGAIGMREIFDTGASTFAQDEESCVVYGMPREAVARGGVQRQVPLSEMAATLLKAC